jgi:predicted nuclease of predicted toxin-antitoxin system
MPWEPIPDPSSEEKAGITERFGKKARFLIDENLDGVITEVLRHLRWNTKGVAEHRLSGHEDEDIFAAAWREDRMVITNDHDFQDDRRFPEHRNPGIIVLPDAPIESQTFLNALRTVLSIIGPLRELYRHSKILIASDGAITIINRNADTGAMERERYRFGKHGETYRWTEPGK